MANHMVKAGSQRCLHWCVQRAFVIGANSLVTLATQLRRGYLLQRDRSLITSSLSCVSLHHLSTNFYPETFDHPSTAAMSEKPGAEKVHNAPRTCT